MGLLRQVTNVFPRFLEILMKYYPGGSYLVMNSMTRVLGYRPLMAIGYNHNSHKIPGYIATEGGGVTVTGEPYLYPFADH